MFGGKTRTLEMLQNRSVAKNIYSKLCHIYPGGLGTGSNLKKHSSDIVKGYSSYFEDSKLLKLLKIKNDYK